MKQTRRLARNPHSWHGGGIAEGIWIVTPLAAAKYQNVSLFALFGFLQVDWKVLTSAVQNFNLLLPYSTFSSGETSCFFGTRLFQMLQFVRFRIVAQTFPKVGLVFLLLEFEQFGVSIARIGVKDISNGLKTFLRIALALEIIKWRLLNVSESQEFYPLARGIYRFKRYRQTQSPRALRPQNRGACWLNDLLYVQKKAMVATLPPLRRLRRSSHLPLILLPMNPITECSWRRRHTPFKAKKNKESWFLIEQEMRSIFFLNWWHLCTPPYRIALRYYTPTFSETRHFKHTWQKTRPTSRQPISNNAFNRVSAQKKRWISDKRNNTAVNNA